MDANSKTSQTVDKITEDFVKSIPLTESGQLIILERLHPGFGLLVGTRGKTFVAQCKIKAAGKWTTRRRKLGSPDTMSVKSARQNASATIIELKSNATEETGEYSPKLGTAWDRYEAYLIKKERATRTIAGYQSHIDLHLKHWLDRSLISLAENPLEVERLHDTLTKNRGKYCANGVLRTLSAIYNHASKLSDPLKGRNPVLAVDLNTEHRRQSALHIEQFANWFEQLGAIDNASRRGFHLITMMTGSRPDALKRAKWSDIDTTLRVWNFPDPKGGSKRRFDIPISDELLHILKEHESLVGQLSNQDWVFPAHTLSGHISETKEPRTRLSHWGNDLRQTFRTLAYLAEIDDITAHILMNHKLDGVNAGYLNLKQTWPKLLEAQTKIIKLAQANFSKEEKNNGCR